MKKFLVLSILLALIIFACAKEGDSVKLEEGTPAYQLAKELSSKLSYLDPDKNNVLITTKQFKITTGEVIQTIQSNFGNRASQLNNLDAGHLNAAIAQNAQELAEKKLLLHAAKQSNTSPSQTAVDSVLNIQYLHAGSEANFLEYLKNNGISVEYVKGEIESGLTIQLYLDEVFAGKTQVTDEEIQKAYQTDKTATVRHILLSTQGKSNSDKQEIRKKMEEILTRARKGEDFAELAKKYSEDPGSKNNGGLYENFGRGRMVKPFDEAAFSVPVGELSDIVETRFGYHILKVIERKKETQPLQEVRPQLEAQIKQKKEKEAYQAHVAKLKEEAGFNLVVY